MVFTCLQVESHIELITRAMLETMVEEVQYLAVFFCKSLYYTVKLHFLHCYFPLFCYLSVCPPCLQLFSIVCSLFCFCSLRFLLLSRYKLYSTVVLQLPYFNLEAKFVRVDLILSILMSFCIIFAFFQSNG